MFLSGGVFGGIRLFVKIKANLGKDEHHASSSLRLQAFADV